LTGISNILNKSSKNQLLIEIECESSPLVVLNQLFSKTDLQKSYSANQFALVGKTPKLLTYKEYLDIYLNHNYECIKREYLFDLEKSKQRTWMLWDIPEFQECKNRVGSLKYWEEFLKKYKLHK
jgi:DNA gyrase subunit A